MSKPVGLQLLGGVNLQSDPARLRDGQAVLLKNMVPVAPGILGTRPAMQWARDILWSFGQTFVPVRMVFSSIGRECVFIAFHEDQMKLVGVSTGNFNQAKIEISLGAATSPKRGELVQWFEDTYGFTGDTSGARLAYAENDAGFVLEQLDFGAGNEDFRPLGAAVVRDRFVYWGYDSTAPGGGRSVLYSDRGVPLDIGSSAVANARGLIIAGSDQGQITFCSEISTQGTGSPNQSALAVWTTDAMWIILGEPGETGDGLTPDGIRGSAQVSQMPVAAGCVSGATVAKTPYGTLWAGPDDVWFLPFGGQPMRVGTNIRPALVNTPPTMKWKWHGAYDTAKAQYRLAIFGQDVGPTEYSGCETHWILDLSAGPPRSADEARWFGPQVYQHSIADSAYDGTLCLQSELGPNGSRNLLGVARFSETVDATPVQGVSLVTLDADDTIDSACAIRDRIPRAGVSEYFVGDMIIPYDEDPGYTRPYVWLVSSVDGLGPSGGGVTDAGPGPAFNGGAAPAAPSPVTDGGLEWTAMLDLISGDPIPAFLPRSMYGERNIIRGEILTREEMWGDPMTEKLIDGAELGYWASRNHMVDYRLLTDYIENSRILQAPPDYTGVVGFTGVAPTNEPLPIRGQRVWKTRFLPSPGSQRSVANSSQIWMKQNLLYPIDSSNDMVVLHDENGNVTYVLPIVHGNYTYAQLVDAIKARLNANTGAGWLFVSSDIGGGSLEGIAWTGGTGIMRIKFLGVGVGPLGTDLGPVRRCARLFQLLGFDVNAAADWGTGSGLLELEIQGATTPPYNWVMARNSVTRYNSSKLQLSGLNARVRPFRRRPV